MHSTKELDTLFLDRDGVLNVKIDDGYVLAPDDIIILDGVPEFLNWARQNFKRIVVVTNQRCVGRGLLKLENLQEINNTINTLTGGNIDKFYVCPHLDEDNCNCRKPKNGLFLQVVADGDVDFENSWMIGDSESDLVPAKKLGLHTIFISRKESDFADQRFQSLIELNHSLQITPSFS